MEVGDLVKQKGADIAVINQNILNTLNMNCIGIIIDVESGVYFSYDGRHRSNVTVKWANGNTETVPEIYLEKVKDEQ